MPVLFKLYRLYIVLGETGIIRVSRSIMPYFPKLPGTIIIFTNSINHFYSVHFFQSIEGLHNYAL